MFQAIPRAVEPTDAHAQPFCAARRLMSHALLVKQKVRGTAKASADQLLL